MNPRLLLLAACLSLPTAAFAGSTIDAAIGGGIGGAAGAAIGNEVGGRSGAIVGGAIGAGVGAAITTPQPRHQSAPRYAPPPPRHHDNGRHKGHYKKRYYD
ncbi:hypothetical protein [Plasticicumulans acidivorans]|uniref:Outer membrane protein with glycine zipper n=1 Tax=Plasticicumulans acidivorans TaxID=886464 RepID=A0A317MZP1_9GAMM|nr:hypothetical protein [Plasticicumulans acidivorans]PWV64762.1 hypothetical protein C7443_102415 [Plasticicumulans acidivorans]